MATKKSTSKTCAPKGGVPGAEAAGADILSEFPLPARVASRQAAEHGLAVSVETISATCAGEDQPCIIWMGSREAFIATGVIAENAFPVRHRWICSGSLRGTLYREVNGEFRFVLEFVMISERASRTEIARARVDAAYQQFRRSMLKPLPQAELSLDSEGGAA